jgi:hypothetical protein
MESLLQRGAELRPLIAETSDVVALANRVAAQVRVMSRELDPMLQRMIELAHDDQLEKHLSTADRVSGRIAAVVTQLEGLQQANAGALAQLTLETDTLVRRWIVYCALAGAGCVLFFWVCYYVVKRLVAAS